MIRLRPFCRDERNGHICHRMLGHPGPHIERHDEVGDDRSVVEWFTTVEYTGPTTQLEARGA